MHDLDRTFMELENAGETEFTGETQWGEVFGEAELQELASELLSVSNEQELNNFLGDLIKRAGSAIGSAIHSPIGQALGGVLKSVAKKALPVAGAALGNMIVPGIGGMVGSNLASAAGSMFGLELEGLSQEDREYEVAKQFVRFAGDATSQAVQGAQQGASPQQAVKDAVTQAAQKFAPGLLQPTPGNGNQQQGPQSPSNQYPGQAASPSPHHRARHGRWLRKGHQIVLLGV